MVKVWIVSLKYGGARYVTDDYSDVEYDIEVAKDEGDLDALVIEEAEMTREELDRLPSDFPGF